MQLLPILVLGSPQPLTSGSWYFGNRGSTGIVPFPSPTAQSPEGVVALGTVPELRGRGEGAVPKCNIPSCPLPHPSTCHDPWADTTTDHILLRWLRSEIRVWLDPGDPRGMAWAFPAGTAAALSHPGLLPAPSLVSCSSSIPQAPQSLPEAVGSSPWPRSPQLSAPLHSQLKPLVPLISP